MTKKEFVQYNIQFSVFFVVVFALPCQGKETISVETRQELVWSQSDGLRYEIYSSSRSRSREGGIWTTPIKITNNNADNFHPVIDIGTDGTKWLFWSAVRPDGISVEYAYFQKNEWSEPKKLPMEQHSAITPSVLADADGTVWLVWAGNDGGNDDILYSRYQASSWSTPKVIHAVNEVPDIKPEIICDIEGKIEVSWLSFRDNMYKTLISVYTENQGWSAEQEKKETEETEEAIALQEREVELPPFLSEDSEYFLKIY